MRVFSLLSTILLLASTACPTAFAANVVYVHQLRGQAGEGSGTTPAAGAGTLAWEDDLWRALIEGAGHTIIAHEAFDNFETDDSRLSVLNSADVVIYSRDTNSGDYNDPAEHEIWTEGITVPMLLMTPFTLRSNRWDMAASTAIQEYDKDANAAGPLVALDKTHPIFTDALDANGEAEVFDPDALGDADSIDFLSDFIDDGKLGNGTVLAMEPNFEVPWIVYWEKDTEFYDGSLYSAGGPRLYYSVGSDDDPYSWGEKNTTPAGDRIFLNAISWLAGEEIGGVRGDYNGNSALDAEDIDMLSNAIRTNSTDPKFDLTGDGKIDGEDHTAWVKDPSLKNTYIGDANLDGEFSSKDFVDTFLAGKYESGENAGWAEGDWTADGLFSSADFVAAFIDGGYELGPRQAVSAVPEPSSVITLLTGIGILGSIVRKRRSK